MPYLITGFAEMTDRELRDAAVALVAQYERTGVGLYKALAERAAEVRASRRVREALFDRWADSQERARLARKRGYDSGWSAGRTARRAEARRREESRS